MVAPRTRWPTLLEGEGRERSERGGVNAKRLYTSPHPDRLRFAAAVDPPPPGEGDRVRGQLLAQSASQRHTQKEGAMTISIARHMCGALAALACMLMSAPDAARAQGYPAHTIQAVIPFAPGNANDV